jgi:hypothetical protein
MFEIIMLAQLAEKASGADQILLLQLLLRENQHEVVEPSLIDPPHRLRIGLFTQIDAANLRADVFRERHDIERRLAGRRRFRGSLSGSGITGGEGHE